MLLFNTTPVPPGDAPINIRIINITNVASFKTDMFIVLNPAVLGVIDWKKLEEFLLLLEDCLLIWNF